MLLEAWRGHAARLLARWQDPSLVVVLRQALQADWQREQALVARFGSGSPVAYARDSIAFALGQLGGFGALLHLEWPAARLRVALLLLVLGSLATTGVFHGQDFGYPAKCVETAPQRGCNNEVKQWRNDIQ